eukprot:1535455-Alexandrium_andersonii.AAC.1
MSARASHATGESKDISPGVQESRPPAVCLAAWQASKRSIPVRTGMGNSARRKQIAVIFVQPSSGVLMRIPH